MTQKRPGRPTKNPKDAVVKFRFDQETLDKMKACSKALHVSNSEVARRSIHLMYQEVFPES